MMYLGRICSQQKLLNLPWQHLRAGALRDTINKVSPRTKTDSRSLLTAIKIIIYHPYDNVENPYEFSFATRRSCDMLSIAFVRSVNNIPVYIPFQCLS